MSRPETTPAESRVRALRTLVVALFVLGLVVASAASGNVAAVLVVAGILGAVGGGLALLRGRSDVLRIRSRGGACAVLAASIAGLFLGGTAFGAPALPHGADLAATAVVASPAPKKAPAKGTALALLETLPVKGRAPMTGYLRTTVFGAAWLDVDHNGCDTRNDVLRRDLTAVTGSRCRVASGVLHDPYTGTTIHFVRGAGTSTAVQIDHMVPLGDAWRTGAQALTQTQRERLANDPINLLAVDGPTNESKGDGDAATWLPKQKTYRCTYVAHQVGVKHAYGLWVTTAERAAMRRVLSACPTLAAPVSTLAKGAGATAAPKPSAAPKSTRAPKPSVAPTASAPVHGGSYCATRGATARTVTGTAVTCTTSATDARLRWRRS
jgi:hypothetical protein